MRTTRRGFLTFCGAAGIGLAGRSAVGKTPGKKSKRPNILFIMSDDHTTQGIGAYGGRLAKLNPTPVIDTLAKEGVLMENVFCTNSICTPSRANIITGQHCQTNGVLDLYSTLSADKHYLPLEMKKAGYATAIIGKWHLKADPSGFDYYCVLPGQGRYYNPIFCTSDGGTRRKVRIDSTMSKTANVVESTGHSSDVITDIALKWLDEKRPADKPFFCMLHYKAPHDMFRYAKRYDKYLEDVDIPEPDNMHDQPGKNFGSIATRGKNDELIGVIGSSMSKRMKRRNMGMHMRIDKKLPNRQYTSQAYQKYAKQFLRCVKGVDDNLKRLFARLRKMGLMDDTIVIYCGDQGFFLGEHDFIDKRWMYDEAIRMAMLVRYPKFIKPGSRCSWIINNTDFAPTMLEMAGAKTPEYMQGRSFLDGLKGKPKPADWPEATYYRYWMHMAHGHNNPAHFGLRTEKYKLIFFYGCDFTDTHKDRPVTRYGGNRYYHNTPVAWEFYDLTKDPKEMHNRYGDRKYAKIIAGLKTQLKKLRADLGETDKKYPRIQKIIDAHWDD